MLSFQIILKRPPKTLNAGALVRREECPPRRPRNRTCLRIYLIDLLDKARPIFPKFL